MANFISDASTTGYIWKTSLYQTTTGVTTDSAAAGSSVDMIDDVANAFTAALIVGAISGTGTPTISMKVQESTTGSGSWSDVADGAFAAVSTANSDPVTVTVKPKYRYLRTTGTVAGTNPVFSCTTIFIAPRTTAPANSGGFSQSAAGSV